MGFDECYNCMKIKYVSKKCEHWTCKKCAKIYITDRGGCLNCIMENNRGIKMTRKLV